MNSQSAFEAVNGKILKAEVSISAGHIFLKDELALPHPCNAIVLFVHGSGSSRHSARNFYVASLLQSVGIDTFLWFVQKHQTK